MQPNISWFVPMGMAQWMKDNTVVAEDRVKEMTWWQEAKLEETEIKIVMTPANHWCKRGIQNTVYYLPYDIHLKKTFD